MNAKTIQSNLKVQQLFSNNYPNSYFVQYHTVMDFRPDFPKKVNDGLHKSYLLPDNKPGIWYADFQNGFFVWCYSVAHKDNSKQHLGCITVQLRSFVYTANIDDWDLIGSAHLGGIFLEETGKTSKAMKLAAEARAVVKRASYLKDVVEVSKYLGSVDR